MGLADRVKRIERATRPPLRFEIDLEIVPLEQDRDPDWKPRLTGPDVVDITPSAARYLASVQYEGGDQP